MASWVELANIALQKVGEEAITSLTQDADRARAVNRIYRQELLSELRTHPWNCARARAQLAADATEPAFGLAYRYPLPADFVRLLPTSTVTDWQVEGRYILTDDTAPLEVIYIAEITDPNQMDALLVDAYTSRLAMRICERLTQSSSKREMMERDYNAAVALARKVNAFENVARERQEDSWFDARL